MSKWDPDGSMTQHPGPSCCGRCHQRRSEASKEAGLALGKSRESSGRSAKMYEYERISEITLRYTNKPSSLINEIHYKWSCSIDMLNYQRVEG